VHLYIIEEQNAMFKMEISILEVYAVVRAPPTHKVIGHNGIPIEVFGMLSKEVGTNLTKFL
jgi:hypothetical protein